MIFKQIPEIVNGTKTETRRVAKPNELMCWVDSGCVIKTYPTIAARLEGGGGGRIKWRVGQDYAVVPKRGHMAVWYKPNSYLDKRASDIGFPTNPDYDRDAEYVLGTEMGWHEGMNTIEQYRDRYPKTWKTEILCTGLVELRIKILSIRREPLQTITWDGAWDEGIGGHSSRPVTDYRNLWDSINKQPGTRWQDNPQVWVIKFEVLRQIEV